MGYAKITGSGLDLAYSLLTFYLEDLIEKQ